MQRNILRGPPRYRLPHTSLALGRVPGAGAHPRAANTDAESSLSAADQPALQALLTRMLSGGRSRPALVAYLVDIGLPRAEASKRADRALSVLRGLAS